MVLQHLLKLRKYCTAEFLTPDLDRSMRKTDMRWLALNLIAASGFCGFYETGGQQAVQIAAFAAMQRENRVPDV